MSSWSHKYAISLGSNLGDRLQYLRDAVASIEELGSDLSVSSLYETEPVGGPEQGPFLNAIAVVNSDLAPLDMLGELQQIENKASRERSVRWGPRTLDLDIVAYSGDPLDSPDLTVPHPRAKEREFVLRPLGEVWAEAVVGDDLSARAALAELPHDGVESLGRGWLDDQRSKGWVLVAIQFALVAAAAVAIFFGGDLAGFGLIEGFGVVLALAGAVLALWASDALGGALTPNPVPRKDAVLVTGGPFSFVRHPIYGGVILLMVGVGLAVSSPWAVAVSLALIPFFWVKSGFEERHLRMAYPGYRAYMERVRHRIVPFVV